MREGTSRVSFIGVLAKPEEVEQGMYGARSREVNFLAPSTT